MSNVVRFLDSLGRQPRLNAGAYAAAVAQVDTGEAQRNALLAADIDALAASLNARATMCCAVFEPSRQPDRDPDADSPDHDADRDSPDEEEDADDDGKSR